MRSNRDDIDNDARAERNRSRKRNRNRRRSRRSACGHDSDHSWLRKSLSLQARAADPFAYEAWLAYHGALLSSQLHSIG